MRRASVALCFALVLALAGCVAQQPSLRSTVAAESPASSEATPPYATLDQAIGDLVNRAQRDDVAYFRPLAPQGDEQLARDMISRVGASGMLESWESRAETSASSAHLDYHSRGNFQVELVRADDGWRVKSVWPCK